MHEQLACLSANAFFLYLYRLHLHGNGQCQDSLSLIFLSLSSLEKQEEGEGIVGLFVSLSRGCAFRSRVSLCSLTPASATLPSILFSSVSCSLLPQHTTMHCHGDGFGMRHVSFANQAMHRRSFVFNSTNSCCWLLLLQMLMHAQSAGGVPLPFHPFCFSG